MPLELTHSQFIPRRKRKSGSPDTANSVAGIVENKNNGTSEVPFQSDRIPSQEEYRQYITAAYGRLGKDGKPLKNGGLTEEALDKMVARVLSPEGQRTREFIRSVYGKLPEEVLTKCILEFLDAQEASNGFDPKRGGGNQIVMNALVHYEIRKKTFTTMNSIMKEHPTAFVPRSSGAPLGPSEIQLRSKLDHAFFGLHNSQGQRIYTSPKGTRRNVAEEGQYIITGMEDEVFSAGGIIVRVGEGGLCIFERKGYKYVTSIFLDEVTQEDIKKILDDMEPLDFSKAIEEESESTLDSRVISVSPKKPFDILREKVYGIAAAFEQRAQGILDNAFHPLVNLVKSSRVLGSLDRFNQKLLKLIERENNVEIDTEIEVRINHLVAYIQSQLPDQSIKVMREDQVGNLPIYTSAPEKTDRIIAIRYDVSQNGTMTLIIDRSSEGDGKFVTPYSSVPHIVIPASIDIYSAETMLRKIFNHVDSNWAQKIQEIVRDIMGNIPVNLVTELPVIYTPKRCSGPIQKIECSLIHDDSQMQIAIYGQEGLDGEYIVIRHDMPESEIRALLEKRLEELHSSVILSSDGIQTDGGVGYPEVQVSDSSPAPEVLALTQELRIEEKPEWVSDAISMLQGITNGKEVHLISGQIPNEGESRQPKPTDTLSCIMYHYSSNTKILTVNGIYVDATGKGFRTFPVHFSTNDCNFLCERVQRLFGYDVDEISNHPTPKSIQDDGIRETSHFARFIKGPFQTIREDTPGDGYVVSSKKGEVGKKREYFRVREHDVVMDYVGDSMIIGPGYVVRPSHNVLGRFTIEKGRTPDRCIVDPLNNPEGFEGVFEISGNPLEFLRETVEIFYPHQSCQFIDRASPGVRTLNYPRGESYLYVNGARGVVCFAADGITSNDPGVTLIDVDKFMLGKRGFVDVIRGLEEIFGRSQLPHLHAGMNGNGKRNVPGEGGIHFDRQEGFEVGIGNK